MNILITGATGFVGGHLCVELIQKKHQLLLAVSSLCDFKFPSTQIVVPEFNNFTISPEVLAGIDVVIHLAARVHVMDEQSSDPFKAFLEVNLHGTINPARQAAAAGVKRFVYVSSIKVNGEYTENKPFDEADLANPQDPYAVSKWKAEQALRQLSEETGMEVVVIRPPLVYGPRVKANFLHLFTVVNKSVPLPLACIHNQRSMIYVGNLVDAIITCATHPKAANQTYLVSDGESVSTPQLIRNIAQALGKRIFLLPFPLSMMKFLARLVGKATAIDRLTQSLVIDNSKIRQELDWTPPFTMTQGLKVTADWYKNQK